jgi:hypothetical protein
MKTPEELEFDKARFDFLKKVTKGRSRSLTSPFNGKNKAQRQRIGAGFAASRFVGELRLPVISGGNL